MTQMVVRGFRFSVKSLRKMTLSQVREFLSIKHVKIIVNSFTKNDNSSIIILSLRL